MSDTRDTIRAVRFGWVALILGVATYALTVAGLMVWGQLDFGMIGTRAMRIVAAGWRSIWLRDLGVRGRRRFGVPDDSGPSQSGRDLRVAV